MPLLHALYTQFLCIIPGLFMYYPLLLWIIAALSCIISPLVMYYPLFFMYYPVVFYVLLPLFQCIITALFYILSLLMDTYFPDPCFSLSTLCIFPTMLHNYLPITFGSNNRLT